MNTTSFHLKFKNKTKLISQIINKMEKKQIIYGIDLFYKKL